MRRSTQPADDSALFDLPLVAEPELPNRQRRRPEGKSGTAAPAAAVTADAEQISLPQEEVPAGTEPEPSAEDESSSTGLVLRRLAAGALDVALLAAALALPLAGAAALGARPALANWPAYLLVALVLSFFYSVFSVLFWGRTPGMARMGLVAHSTGESPLTISRAVLRWLGGVCTVALLGLPTLLDLGGGGSLGDRISGSRIDDQTG